MGSEIIVDRGLANVATTKILTITTAATLVRMESGNTSMLVFNCGPTDVYYGGSTVSANSGGVIWTSGTESWKNVLSNFGIFMIANSADSQIAVVEYD